MQLKNKRGPASIRRALAAATCSLLCSTSQGAESDWSMEISGLYYSESERVLVNKLQTKVRRDREDANININLVYDTMTGSSPNGRLYTGNSDTGSVAVTTASGFAFDVSGGTGAQAGSQPWLTPFEDTRIALSADWSRPWNRTLTTKLGGGASKENDYLSIGANLVANFNLFQKTSTLSLGMSANLDVVDPGGGIPEGLAKLECASSTPNLPAWVDCSQTALKYEAAQKLSSDFIIGFTQVWNRRTLLQANLVYGKSQGYLTDPYKQVSVVDEPFNSEIAVLHEKRPDSRDRYTTYWKLVHQLRRDVVYMSYRYFWDDWSVVSHTLDFRYRWEFRPRQYLQPHIRWNNQSAAYFFGTHITSADDQPVYFSADHRLGRQTTVTVGVKYGFKVGDHGEIGLRAEMIQQQYEDNPLPDMQVGVLQSILSFKF